MHSVLVGAIQIVSEWWSSIKVALDSSGFELKSHAVQLKASHFEDKSVPLWPMLLTTFFGHQNEVALFANKVTLFNITAENQFYNISE